MIVSYFGYSTEITISIKTDTLIELSIDTTQSRVTILSNHWNINYQHSVIIDLNVINEDKYIFEAICENEEIGICLLDSIQNVIAVGKEPNTRVHKRTISKRLYPGQYSLLIGSGTSKNTSDVKLAIHGVDDIVTWRTGSFPIITLEKKKVSGKIDSLGYVFEGVPTKVYKIECNDKEKFWYKIKAISDSFEPFLIVLDNSDEVRKFDNYESEFNNFPDVIISPTDTVQYLLIGANSTLNFDNNPFYEFNLKIRKYSYDPESSIIEKVKKGLNPLNTFLLGLVFAFIISYYFYRKSIKSRKLLHWELTDNILLSQDSDHKDHVMKIGDKSAISASHYKYHFENLGRKRIDYDQVKNDIILELTNVEEILDLNFNYVGEGWKVPEQINKNRIKINFKHVDPKDYLTLSIICSINKEEQNKKGIIPKVNGYISETDFYERTNKPRSLLTLLIHATNYFNLLLLLPILIITDLFQISMPYWYNKFAIFYWPITIVLLYTYFLTIGRDYVINAHKILWFYIKKTVKTTANKVYKK